ncbi:MAG: hypothetical protein ACTSWY_14855 [Promethearchaeota archaeon]
MAKHGKKKIRFHFDDINFATFFLDFIRKKKFYSHVTGSMKKTRQLEITLTGSSENVRIGIQKIKKLYNKAHEKYLEDSLFDGDSEAQDDLEDKIDEDNKENELNLHLKLKNLKFND